MKSHILRAPLMRVDSFGFVSWKLWVFSRGSFEGEIDK